MSQRRRRRWARTPYARLIGAGVVVAVLGGVAALAGRYDSGVFLLFGAVFVALAWLAAWRIGGLAALPCVLLGFLLLATGLSDASIHLASFDSFGEFGSSLAAPTAGLLVMAGALGALAARVRGRDVPPRWPDAIGRAVVAVFALVVLASVVVTIRTPTTVGAAEREGAAYLSMADTSFRPGTLRAKAGEELRILLDNPDGGTHTFSMDDPDVDEIVGPRRQKLIRVRFPAPGRFEFYCRVGGHGDQTGAVVVEG